MSKEIELDWQSRQQIAVIAGIAGAIATTIIAWFLQDKTGINPLLAGVIGWVLAAVFSLLSRKLGVVIIVLAAGMVLLSCRASQGQ